MSETRLRYLAAIGAAAIAAWGLAAAAAVAGELDGKTFVVQSGEQGKPAQGPLDEIVFREGKMHSAGCDPYGFGDGSYTTMHHPDSIMFHARTDSAKQGAILWTGQIHGDELSGGYVWTKPGQKPIEYWMKGTLKKENGGNP
ncbi:MAG TPA: hypothetical protein VFL12_03835 [Thermoanaerobaculia bacterium]|nr:hypothetical protein [Thermoanaerobaculia bacterium]